MLNQKIYVSHPTLKITSQISGTTQSIIKLFIENANARIIIEPNLILRGTIYPIKKMDLAPAVETRFKTFVSNVPIASFNDVYAGKICAALGRQHPRDLFDVKLLLEDKISEELKKAFLIYLVSNNRPMYELLEPYRLDQRQVYQDEFVGMTNLHVSYEELIEAREALIKEIKHVLADNDKEFLVSIKRGNPEWNKIELPNIDQLPGIKWKLLNIRKMNKEKHKAAIEKLERVLA
jgi:Nucleotidyl transferase AbiEii toxin, Type IV TA system